MKLMYHSMFYVIALLCEMVTRDVEKTSNMYLCMYVCLCGMHIIKNITFHNHKYVDNKNW